LTPVDTLSVSLGVWTKKEFLSEIGIYQQYQPGVSPVGVLPTFAYRQWYHACYTFQRSPTTQAANVELFVDGVSMGKGLTDAVMGSFDCEKCAFFLAVQENMSPLLPGFLVLGQDQDIPGGLFEEDSAWCGDIAQVNIWKSIVAADVIRSTAKCQTDPQGDLIPWDVDQWEAHGEVEFRCAGMCLERD